MLSDEKFDSREQIRLVEIPLYDVLKIIIQFMKTKKNMKTPDNFLVQWRKYYSTN